MIFSFTFPSRQRSGTLMPPCGSNAPRYSNGGPVRSRIFFTSQFPIGCERGGRIPLSLQSNSCIRKIFHIGRANLYIYGTLIYMEHIFLLVFIRHSKRASPPPQMKYGCIWWIASLMFIHRQPCLQLGNRFLTGGRERLDPRTFKLLTARKSPFLKCWMFLLCSHFRGFSWSWLVRCWHLFRELKKKVWLGLLDPLLPPTSHPRIPASILPNDSVSRSVDQTHSCRLKLLAVSFGSPLTSVETSWDIYISTSFV